MFIDQSNFVRARSWRDSVDANYWLPFIWSTLLTTSRPYTFKILWQLSLETVTARVPLPIEHDIMGNQDKFYFNTVHGAERAVKVIEEPMDTEFIISDDEVQFLLRVIIHPFLLSIPFRVHTHKLVSLNKMGQVHCVSLGVIAGILMPVHSLLQTWPIKVCCLFIVCRHNCGEMHHRHCYIMIQWIAMQITYTM